MEANQNQVVVCVVPCVSDHHVLEQMMFCAQYVIGPEANRMSPVEHALRPVVPQSQLTLWEAVPTHTIETRPGHGCRDLLVLRLAI